MLLLKILWNYNVNWNNKMARINKFIQPNPQAIEIENGDSLSWIMNISNHITAFTREITFASRLPVRIPQTLMSCSPSPPLWGFCLDGISRPVCDKLSSAHQDWRWASHPGRRKNPSPSPWWPQTRLNWRGKEI